MKRDFDVVIVGGGMVGAGCAALLGAYGPTSALRVAMLEPRTALLPAPDEPLDLRVSALSRASQRLVERTGAWQEVLARGASPYQRMVVWDKVGSPDGEGSIRFEAAELGEPDLGHIVENRTVQAALTARAAAHGVTLLRSGVSALDLGAEAVTVTTTEGRRLSAALVVAADGGDSAARRHAGIETQGWDYGQHAVVTHLSPSQPHRGTAWQRFLPTGPLALLPLSDGRVSLVWSALPERAAELVAMSGEAFADAVTEASAGVLGRLVPDAPRASFPLRLLHAIDYTRPRLALVGDAAEQQPDQQGAEDGQDQGELDQRRAALGPRREAPSSGGAALAAGVRSHPCWFRYFGPRS